jgi:hypothetical protein
MSMLSSAKTPESAFSKENQATLTPHECCLVFLPPALQLTDRSGGGGCHAQLAVSPDNAIERDREAERGVITPPPGVLLYAASVRACAHM